MHTSRSKIKTIKLVVCHSSTVLVTTNDVQVTKQELCNFSNSTFEFSAIVFHLKLAMNNKNMHSKIKYLFRVTLSSKYKIP